MTDRPMNLLGWYVEESEDAPNGVRVVLVQPHAEEEYVEHAVESPTELWAAFMAILQDPALPAAQHNVQSAAAGGGGEGEGGDDLFDFACDQAEGVFSDMGGATFGRIATAVIRNPGIGMKLLQRISRNRRKE